VVDKERMDEIKDIITSIIKYVGDDPCREGLRETPDRVLRSWRELFSGYTCSPREVFKSFDSGGYDQIVLLKDIEVFSICEHHMLPFFGRTHVAYIPGSKVIGVSKLARLVEIYSRRLQIQERIGEQVTSILMEYLEPKGAACVIEARHLCMMMRGVSKQHSKMITSSLKGVFLEHDFRGTAARVELMELLKHE